MDLLPALRLECQQCALFFPACIVLQGLEGREIDAQTLLGDLLVDDRREDVAKISGKLDLDAGKALLELAHPRFIKASRTTAIQRQRALILCSLIELVDRLRGCRSGKTQHKQQC